MGKKGPGLKNPDVFLLGLTKCTVCRKEGGGVLQ